MNKEFVAEILRATGSLRAGDPAAATDIIQAALAAGGLTSRPPGGSDGGTKKRDMPETLDLRVAGSRVGPGPDSATPAGRAGPAQNRRLRLPLGKTLRMLARGRKDLGQKPKLPGLQLPGQVPHLPLPEGAEFRDLNHASAAGMRRYRLYVPASAGEGLQGLVVMLHGCTQNPEDFAAGTGMNEQAEAHRLLVAYPAQTGSDNPMACWNWFRPGDQRRGAGEPAIIAGLTESIRDEFGIPPDRVFVAGLSAGGAMAAIMAETYPDLYAAAGIHSGLAHGSANDVMSAFSAMQGQAPVDLQPARSLRAAEGAPRVIVFHGSADATVHPANADRIIAGLTNAAMRLERSEHPGAGARRGYTRMVARREDGVTMLEAWIVDGAPHAWSGGDPRGSHTDPNGPKASAEMVRFFLDAGLGGDTS